METVNQDDKAFQLIIVKRLFYRRNFHSLFILSLILSLLATWQIYIFFDFYYNDWRTVFFSVDSRGFPKPPSPTNQPLISKDIALKMAEDMVKKAFTLNYISYSDQIAEIQANFKTGGFTSFRNQLINSGIIARMIRNSEIVYPKIVNKPTLMRAGIEQGTYVWIINVPINLQYIATKTNELSIQPLSVEIKLSRVPMYQNPTGIAIVYVQASG